MLKSLEQRLADDAELVDEAAARTDNPEYRIDWWVDLFPPRYPLEDIEKDEECEVIKSESDSTLTDIDKEPNVYRRVWLRLQAEEEALGRAAARRRYELAQQEAGEDVPTAEPETPPQPKDEVDSSIWSREELLAIRSVIAELKSERAKLRAVVRSQAERLEILERKCRSQNKELNSQWEKLTQAKCANERFQLLTAAQVNEARSTDKQISQRETLIRQLQEKNSSLRAKLQKSSESAERCRARATILELRLQDQSKAHEAQLRNAVEAALATSRGQIQDLRTALARSEKATRLEEERHRATRKGLDLLLRHQNQLQQSTLEHNPDLLAAKLQLL